MVPPKVNKVSILEYTTTSYTLTWESLSDISYYEVYEYDNNTGASNYISVATANQYTIYDSTGAIKYYRIGAVKDNNGTKYIGELSEPFAAAIPPEKVDSLTVTGTTETSAELSWSIVNGASGYSIYRKKANETEFTYVGSTSANTYKDTGLSAGTQYQYKISAYKVNEMITGEASTIAEVYTKLTKVSLKYKAGDKKVRLIWNKITGATSYDIYMGDELNGYSLLTTVNGNSNNIYTVEGLIYGVTYDFYVTARGSYNGISVEGTPSAVVSATITEIPETNKTPKYFIDEAAFIQSSAYQKIPFFRENVKYSDSYIIPGLVTTNVGGFVSSSMCPHGVTFAGNYLLITAYDLADEENSVIYVIDKASKELLTTVILPTDAHVGGICYDGKYVWLSTGSRASGLLLSDIDKAVASGLPYYNVEFFTVNKLGISASYITYYDGKLWVGTYNELNTTYMYSFDILDFDTEVQLEKVDTIKMPTRVQGIAFTEEGYLLLSRSCQLYSGLRGYMRRLDVYKPDLTDEDLVVKSLGKCLNYVYTPSMNEGIAIDGSMLYILFESAAFAKASYKVDRVAAFDLSSVLNNVTLANK